LVAWVDGIGIFGPGLPNWQVAKAVLSGSEPYDPRSTELPVPLSLPPTERRRAGKPVRIALAVANEAINAAEQDAKQVATVFSSSGADADNCDVICRTLASEDRHISPTRFHNSVHNAPAGYWAIASGAMTPATALSAFDGSFGAGLLEGLTEVKVDGIATLLVTYDVPYPEPLHVKRPLLAAFGIALALMRESSSLSLARIEVQLTEAPYDTMVDPQLEAIRRGIPSARGLPLLHALARGTQTTVVLEYIERLQLVVVVNPCR
jgi:hypothetical protein